MRGTVTDWRLYLVGTEGVRPGREQRSMMAAFYPPGTELGRGVLTSKNRPDHEEVDTGAGGLFEVDEVGGR